MIERESLKTWNDKGHDLLGITKDMISFQIRWNACTNWPTSKDVGAVTKVLGIRLLIVFDATELVIFRG